MSVPSQEKLIALLIEERAKVFWLKDHAGMALGKRIVPEAYHVDLARADVEDDLRQAKP